MKRFLIILLFFLSVSFYGQIDSSTNIYYVRVDTNYYDRHGLFLTQTELKDGNWIILYNNGKTYAKYNLKDKKIIDTAYYYWPNGNLLICEVYKNGLLDGEKKNYHRNGKINVISFWSNGLKVGIWKYYNDKGKLIKKIKGIDSSTG